MEKIKEKKARKALEVNIEKDAAGGFYFAFSRNGEVVLRSENFQKKGECLEAVTSAKMLCLNRKFYSSELLMPTKKYVFRLYDLEGEIVCSSIEHTDVETMEREIEYLLENVRETELVTAKKY